MKQITKWFNPVMLVVILLPFFQYFATGVQTVMAQPTVAVDPSGRDITTLSGASELADAKDTDGNATKTIFNDVKMTSNGQQITDQDTISVGDNVNLTYSWSLPEALRQQMDAGDYFRFKLPANFDVTNFDTLEMTDQDDSTVKLGTVSFANDGTVTIVFDKFTRGDIKGKIRVFGVAKRVKDTDQTKTSIPFTSESTSDFPPVKVSNKTDLTKDLDGDDNSAIKYNDDQQSADVTWKVTMNNERNTLYKMGSDKSAKLSDTLPVGVKDIKDLHVTAQKLDDNGQLVDDPDGAALLQQQDNTEKDGQTVLNFGLTADTHDVYTLTYTTTVPNKELAVAKDGNSSLDGKTINPITNTADFSNNGGDVLHASKNVELGYDAKVSKTSAAFDKKTGLIKWTIHMQKSGAQPLPAGITMTDDLANGQTVLGADGKSVDDLSKLIDDQDWTIAKKSDSQYTITSNKADARDFTVTYYTKPDGGNYDKTTFDSNTNTLTWNNTGITVTPTPPTDTPDTGDGNGDGTGKPTEQPKPNISKNGDYERYELIDGKQVLVNDWTIEVNANHASAPNLVVTDKMTDGLILASDDKNNKFDVVADQNGGGDQPLNEGTDYTITPDADKQGFKIDLSKWDANKDDAHLKSKITIKYHTYQTKMSAQTNSASINPDNGGGETGPRPTGSLKDFGMSKSATLDTSAGGTDPVSGTINWEVGLNGEKVLLPNNPDDTVMVDPLPEGLTLVNGVAGVKVLSYGDDVNNQDTDVTKDMSVQYVDTVDQKTLDQVQLHASDIKNGDIIVKGFGQFANRGYKIQYATKLANNGANNQNIVASVNNTAHYYDSRYGHKEANKDFSFVQDSDVLKKDGYLTDENGINIDASETKIAPDQSRHAKYSVIVHPSENEFTLKNSTVTDTFGANVIFSDKELNLGNYDGKDQFPDEFSVAYQSKPDDHFAEVPLTDSQNANTSAAKPTYSVQKMQTGFILTFHGDITEPVVINYTTAIRQLDSDADGSMTYTPTNSVKLTGNYETSDITDRFDTIKIEHGSATATGDMGSLLLQKKSTDGKNLAGAEFDLNKVNPADGSKLTTIAHLTTDDNGQVQQDNIEPGSYQLVETKAPDGYGLKNSDVFKVTGNNTTDAPAKVTIVDPDNTTISGTKTWDDANNQDGKRPDSITVHLVQKLGEKVTETKDTKVTKADDWKYSFNNLPVTDDQGQKYDYTVTEDKVDGYTSTVDKNNNITNTHTPDTTTISGTKTWDDNDNQDGIRPASITVNLFADGKKVDGKTQTVTEKDNWQYSFKDLPKYENGKEVTYTVTEDAVKDYTTEIDKDTNNITNTHKPVTTKITGTKMWSDDNNRAGVRPDSITVDLLADGEKYDSKQVTAADAWQYKFTNLPQFKDGKEIKYTVAEENVPAGYHSEVDGTNILNTYTPEKVDVEGHKTWDDANNQDGKRPESIKVDLLANGLQFDQRVVTAADNWAYSFKNLPKEVNGQDVTYTIAEELPKDENNLSPYTSSVDGYNLTNKHTPEITFVEGKKMWSDDNNRDGARPDSITVDLLADGQKVDSKQVTAADAWQYKFTNLPKFKGGKEINYTVDEDVVPAGYSKEVDGKNILNTYTPETVNVEGHKTWSDAHNQDGKRPGSITVVLKANNLQVDQRVVTAKDNWAYSFKNLPKNDNGKTIKYTISEEPIKDVNGLELPYTPSVQGYNLTNTYTPETTKVSGTKTWKDANNQDGKRPSSITVKLLANGSEIKSKKVTAADKWQYSFDNLPVYKNGQKIVYTIGEDTVDGYTSKATNFDLTNTHTPATTQVTGTKTWDDANNQDGIRPTSIDVELLKNGQEFKYQTVTQADNWQYSFTDLPQYEDGKEINYTIAEAKVDGYKTNINGTDLTNSHTPATTEISGHKTWDDADDQDGKRPSSITVNLFADGKQVQSKKVTASDNWQYSFTNLDEYKDGVKINYTIDEDSPAGYIKTIKGTDLTNSYRPEETQVEGYKVWNDANDQDGKRPSSITVNLLANGKQVQSKTVTAKDDWRYNFTGLPKNDHGKKIVYTIDEASVAGYSKKISGYNLTNTHQPATTKVTGTKTWNDANNQDGKRPGSITVYLLANGQKVQSKQVSASDNWQYSFTNLPQYANGKQINYSIDESDVAGYSKSVNGTNLTNTHTPDLVAVTGTKTWNDAANQDGMRPDSITVTLLANGKAVQTRTVSAATNWQYNFTSLPKYADGKAISYTVDENAVAGYTKSVSGYDLTNTHTPETTAVAGTKTWNDNNDQDGKRPESITVRLLANGVEAASKTVTAADNWQYNFTDLPKYADGKAIVYTVAEDAVAGYTTTTDGDNLTNTHTPEVTAVAGTKTWLDDDDTYGMRPESITVHLLANGKTVATKEVTADDNWQYSFTNLPVFANGKQIVYTLSEDEVDGYTSSVDGYDLTNTILPFPPLPNTFGNVPPTGPHTPNQPNKPNQPKTPHTPGQPGNGSHLPDTFGGLPQTGDANNQWVLTLLGAGMLVTLLAVALRKREEFKA